MFSGLVQAVGTLAERTARGPGFRVKIRTNIGPLVLGESIAVSGVCLSVAEVLADGFLADVSAETVSKTTLGRVPLHGEVNLERSLSLADRLGGHLVLGHVDGVASVEAVTAVGEALRVVVRVPAELARFVAVKGSVTLDGVSLTVNSLQPGAGFDVMLIPQTLALTTLKHLARGSELNVEIDLLARYVVHWLESTERHGRPSALERALEGAGFMGPGAT
jgi:riboflavin synthase